MSSFALASFSVAAKLDNQLNLLLWSFCPKATGVPSFA
jgi:hypothetical protein